MKPCSRSTAPLACGSRGRQKCQPTLSCPQSAANSSLGRPSWPWMPAWIPDQCVGQSAQLPQAAANPGQQLRLLLAEHQRAGAGARVAQARNDDPARASLAMTDRHLELGLPDVELADLARPIDRALRRPRRAKQRPHLAQVVIEDRLAAVPAQQLKQLTDPHTRQITVLAKQPRDLGLEWIDLRATPLTRVLRRLVAGDRSPDRLAMQPRPAADLSDRQPAHEPQAPDLRPLLHPDHPRPPRLALRGQAQGPKTTGQQSGGPDFNRRRWSSLHPAPTPRWPFRVSLA
jgi:hypothetical protein